MSHGFVPRVKQSCEAIVGTSTKAGAAREEKARAAKRRLLESGTKHTERRRLVRNEKILFKLSTPITVMRNVERRMLDSHRIQNTELLTSEYNE